jgi:hypothetical protein
MPTYAVSTLNNNTSKHFLSPPPPHCGVIAPSSRKRSYDAAPSRKRSTNDAPCLVWHALEVADVLAVLNESLRRYCMLHAA